jgi:hypothetical protein
MPFTPGDFTPSQLQALVVKEADLLLTDRSMSELSKDIVAGAALLQHQDPSIVTDGVGLNCINAKIYTSRLGNTDKGNKTVACAVSVGPQAGTEAIPITKEVLVNLERFTINDNLCANAEDFNRLYAENMLKVKAKIEGKLSSALVAAVDATKDLPVAGWFETAGTVVTLDKLYTVTAANFKSGDVLSDFLWAGKVSGMNDPIVLNGRNFFNDAIKNQFESNGCCTNDAILNGNRVFQVYWDSQNVDQVTGARTSLLVDKNAVLFWSSPGYANLGISSMMTEGKEANDTYHYVDTLPRLQYYANGQLNPIYVDVRLKWGCLDGGANIVPRNGWNVEVMLLGAITPNLANTDGYQGVIRVDRV